MENSVLLGCHLALIRGTSRSQRPRERSLGIFSLCVTGDLNNDFIPLSFLLGGLLIPLFS